MTKPPKSTSENAPKGQTSQEARAERQAKALRDNLRRRKQQARGRDGASPPEDSDSLDSQSDPD
ncbi:MAG: hypothetical protein HN644_12760 [Rhodospirillales bacterium]|jgi:hypothetical protein|nr:hypothetical protein [Rhodospirillales bacterium]MBT4040210.1 hypothetical protein [Rhodospirillales bacterium]MBT4627959.1 hypothetical protein [Rhodospirillales bacterium]MBT5350322.1 hypothetical protein [Rhodospirillales bacterium]MBT5521305.1 hypothetical protein [Rhodospirillales bacterium]